MIPDILRGSTSLEELVVGRMDRNGGQAGLFFENPEVRKVIQGWMLDQVYDRIRASHSAGATTTLGIL